MTKPTLKDGQKLKRFLGTLKIHNKDVDVCINDALAVRYLLVLISELTKKAKRQALNEAIDIFEDLPEDEVMTKDPILLELKVLRDKDD